MDSCSLPHRGHTSGGSRIKVSNMPMKTSSCTSLTQDRVIVLLYVLKYPIKYTTTASANTAMKDAIMMARVVE